MPGRWVLAAALGAALAWPASGQATVTIGSNLGRAPIAGAASDLSAAQEVLPAGSRAPGGLISPVNGMTTQWRVRAGDSGPLGFQVVRPLGSNLFTGAGTTPLVTPAPNAISAFALPLPISIGDRIGISNTGDFGALDIAFPDPSSRINIWRTPALANGGPGRAPESFADTFELTINAEIEPTSTFQVTQVQKLKRSRLRVTADLPNPGTLTAGDNRDASIATAAAKKKRKKKPKLLQQISAAVAAPGQATLIVGATKAARKKLKRKFLKTGKKKAQIKAQLKLSFTPTGGTASTTVTKTKLRR